MNKKLSIAFLLVLAACAALLVPARAGSTGTNPPGVLATWVGSPGAVVSGRPGSVLHPAGPPVFLPALSLREVHQKRHPEPGARLEPLRLAAQREGKIADALAEHPLVRARSARPPIGMGG